VKQISIFVLGFAAAFASASAPAQDLTAGKTPAQLFRSDCAECHRSPGGIARTRDVRALADFLREHYTTKSETAGALAAYVSSFAAGAAGRNRGTGGAAPAPGGYREVGRRNRGEADATANEGDTGAQAKPAEDSAGRHRRTTSLSGDRDKRGVDSDGEVSRPPAGLRTTPASKSNARTRGREPRDGSDPISRLRSYLSGGGAENATGETGKTEAPKARKRRNRVNAELPASDARAKTKSDADTPPSAATSAPAVPPAVTSP
jgi:hypothetical protein